jgi:hypothetical protein
MPIIEQVVIYRLVIYKDVLCELRRIIVKEITECLDELRDGSGEIGVVLRQLFRERDEGIKRPGLLSRERAEGGGERTASEGIYTLRDGMGSCPILRCENVLDCCDNLDVSS